MRISVANRGLWLLFTCLAAACTFYAATDFSPTPEFSPSKDESNRTVVLSSNVSTVIVPTSAPNATTHTNVTSAVPTHTTATVNHTTASSNVTAITNGSMLVTTQPTTHSKPASISVPTKSTPVTSTSSSAVVTVTPASTSQKITSNFDAGSFVGGIVLTLGILIVLYLGCKFYASKRGVQYRTIDEHEAII